jgi:hypothetical protein
MVLGGEVFDRYYQVPVAEVDITVYMMLLFVRVEVMEFPLRFQRKAWGLASVQRSWSPVTIG